MTEDLPLPHELSLADLMPIVHEAVHRLSNDLQVVLFLQGDLQDLPDLPPDVRGAVEHVLTRLLTMQHGLRDLQTQVRQVRVPSAPDAA